MLGSCCRLLPYLTHCAKLVLLRDTDCGVRCPLPDTLFPPRLFIAARALDNSGGHGLIKFLSQYLMRDVLLAPTVEARQFVKFVIAFPKDSIDCVKIVDLVLRQNDIDRQADQRPICIRTMPKFF